MGKNFKLPALCAAVLLGFIQNGNAQDEHLELSSRYDNNRNAVIEVQYHDGGVYSVVLEFYELSNFMVEKFRRAKVISKSQIAVLKPENPVG